MKGKKKTAPTTQSRRGARRVLHPPCSVIPRQVASQQSLPPLHRTKANIIHHPRSVKKKQKKRACRRVRLHRPFLAEEALACFCQSEVAPRLGEIPSVNLIETAWQCETVAAEYSVSCLAKRHERLPL
jgi:hypothetical protein